MSNPASDDRASGARRATIKDVAREAGVSFKTVSRVMNRDGHVNAEMRAAVETAMAALGYRPHRAARALRTSRTYAIALIAGSRDEPAPGERVQFPEYLGEVIAGCTRACRSAGFHLVLELLTYGDQRRAAGVAAALLDDLAPDGIVLTPPLCDLGWLLDILEERAIPFVRLMPGAFPERGACLAVNDFSAASELTERLLAAGHRHLAFDAGPPDHPAPARASAKATSSSPRASARPAACSPVPTARARCSPPTTPWRRARSRPRLRSAWRCRTTSRSPASTIPRSPR